MIWNCKYIGNWNNKKPKQIQYFKIQNVKINHIICGADDHFAIDIDNKLANSTKGN